MTKILIFDFWGTLVENGVRPSPSKQVKYFLRLRMPFSKFITQFEEVFMTKPYDNLREGFEAVVQSFDKRIPDFVYDKLVGMWNKFTILSKPFDDTFETLDKLKEAGYKMVLLSNTDVFSLRQVMDKFDLEKYFEKVYLSSETGMLKTNKKSFEQICDDFSVKPEDCLMIGDSPQSDIVSAEEAGVPAVLVDRRDWATEVKHKISSLHDLPAFLDGSLDESKDEPVNEEEPL